MSKLRMGRYCVGWHGTRRDRREARRVRRRGPHHGRRRTGTRWITRITDTSIHVDIYNWQVGNDRTKERKRTQDVAGGGGKSEGRRKEVLRDGRWGIVVSSRRRREEDGRDRERERERGRTSRRHPPACFLLQHSSSMPAPMY